MQLSFNLEDILYLKLSDADNSSDTVKLAIKEKKENEMIAIAKTAENIKVHPQQMVSVDIVCNDGLYHTQTFLKDIIVEGEYTRYIMANPKSLDYQQNRLHYRILTNYDCIYTVETENGNESFNATTYDISASGISIITDENIVSMEEMSILIFMRDRDIKSHLKFVRCEIYENNSYKLSFEFMDLSERDIQYLNQLCTYKQLQ